MAWPAGSEAAARRVATTPPNAWPAAMSAANSAATGLHSADRTANPHASAGSSESSARIAPSAGSAPNANASLPEYRSAAVAAPNSTAPTQPRAPKWRQAMTVNTAAVPVVASAAASCGLSTADTAGNSTL